jgi:hypothetical protein
MAITVKHSKVSTIPDDADTSLVRPSDWNADHTLTGLGTMAEQNANNVNITGGSITGVTGVGDVVGPASSTDNAIARFDTTTGKLIQNSGVTIDDNSNITANALNDGYLNTAASGTLITLTSASIRRYTITGSGGQTIKLPNATTLPNGAIFEFDNNQSSGAITVNNNSNTLVVSVPSGGVVRVNLLSNAIAAGSWDRHDLTPANVSWSTNTLDYAGSITSATWNGNAVAYNRGGTGQSSLFVAGGIVYGSTTTALAVTPIGTTGQVLTSAGAGIPTWTTPTTGTVTSVSGTGTVNGITLSGTVTSTGNLTLGGTLSGVSLTTQVSGTLPVANGGTGATTLTGLVVGNGTSAMTTVTAPSGTVVGTSDTQTLTNKRVNPRAVAAGATSGTITPNGDTTDVFNAFSLTGAITVATPSGTPVDGQRLMLRFEDNGTGRGITWTGTSGAYRAVGVTLPTTTVASKVTYVGCVYNSNDTFWDAIAVATQA